jgi:hypothetical protein
VDSSQALIMLAHFRGADQNMDEPGHKYIGQYRTEKKQRNSRTDGKIRV